MPMFEIEGVDVSFPFTPYDVQMQYMKKVIYALKSNQNAVLESPTGTGKTLCLLCATLAWRKSELDKLKASNAASNQDVQLKEGLGAWGEPDKNPEANILSVPKIIYASRTHSQLTQVVRELKKTDYGKGVTISILGSREQMCIHPDVSKQTNNQAMVHMCRNKVNKHTCHFYNNVEDARKNNIFTTEVLDIEDLVTVGKRRNACPYYTTREISKQPECGVIFTPYNYLLDRKMRGSQNLEIGGNILIFDEAHNLEKQCEESASFDLSSMDVANCIEEVGDLLSAVSKMEETGVVMDGHEAGESSALSEFNKEELALMKSFFLAVEKNLDEIDLSNSPNKSKAESGRFIFDFFAKVNLTFETSDVLLELMDKISSYLSTLSNSFKTRGLALQKFSEVIKIVFTLSSNESTVFASAPTQCLNRIEELSKFYRTHICEEAPKKNNSANLWKKDIFSSKQNRILSYWCFSPGYAMKDLVTSGVRNIILTSGTLSPIDTFVAEFQVDFPVTLENAHVIDGHQVFVAALTKGSQGGQLESTFKTRNNPRSNEELGHTVAEVSNVSPGGLLVFFPSYAAMEHYVKIWTDSSNIMSRLESIKPCTVEPRNKHELKESIEKYYNDVKSPQGGAFFAVCRGKVSEGLDFANDNGRSVIIIGIPFPPMLDPKVKLKKQFLDDVKRTSSNKCNLSGMVWYQQQACRAVNQAIGRVIRHRYDFGAIILCDYRYSRSSQINELPKWIQPHVVQFTDFAKSIRRLKSFFCSIREKEKVRLGKFTSGSVNKKEVKKIVEKSETSIQLSFGGIKPKSLGSIKFLPKMSEPDCHVPSRGSNLSVTSHKIKKSEYSLESKKRKRENVSQSSKKVSLFEALENEKEKKGLETVEKDQISALSEAEALRTSTSMLVMDKRMDEERKGKRKKIVVKSRNQTIEQFSEGRSNNKDENKLQASSTSKDTDHNDLYTKLRKGDVGTFISTVKTCLSDEQYKIFRNAINKYRTCHDLNELFSTYASIFVGNPVKKILLKSFVRFVKPHHKTVYRDMCDNFVKSTEKQSNV